MAEINLSTFEFRLRSVAWQAKTLFPAEETAQLPGEKPCSRRAHGMDLFCSGIKIQSFPRDPLLTRIYSENRWASDNISTLLNRT